jgi:RHS repeat-associated protein
MGNVTSVTPPSRSVHAFGYTPVNLTETYTSPSAPATHYAYNKDRQLISVSRPDGTAIGLTYDQAGRLATMTTPHGEYQHTYSAVTGALASVSAPDGASLAFGYDGALLTSTTWSGAVAGSVAHSYDNDFRVVSENGAGYQYDNDGLLIAAGGLSLAYDSRNGLMTGTHIAACEDLLSYDEFGDMTRYAATAGAAEMLAVDYQRDSIGRITGMQERVAGAASAPRTFEYDGAGRLIRVKSGSAVVAEYDYDGNGNRTAYRAVTNSATATYDGDDRLLTYGDTVFTYTANGELASKTTLGQTTTFDYDVLGNLRHVGIPGRAIDYVIDAQNRRVGKKVDGVLTQGWLYGDQLRIVAELDGTGASVARFIYGSRSNVPDLMIRGGVTYRLVTDHLGSPRLVVNTTDGSILQRMDYDEFGRVTLDSNPGFQPFGFAGGLYDRDTGLVRFGARDYDPHVGRFVSKDPIGFAGNSANLYSYSFNDPVNFGDPSGLLTVPFVGWVDVGENAGAAALEQWADHITDPNTTGLDLIGSYIGGFFAALWTPCTSDRTFTTLSVAYGANTYVGRSFYQYYPANNAAYNSRYLTRGAGWKAPYSTGTQAAEKLSLPPWNQGTAVQKVPNAWNQWVGGPRMGGAAPKFGHTGGGTEYVIGGWPQ